MLSIALNIVPLQILPEQLTERVPMLTPTIGIGLFVAFIIVSLAKLLKSNVFTVLAVSNVKVQGLQSFLRESYPLNKGGSILLLINYLLSFSLVLYIITGFSSVVVKNELLLVGLIPLALLLWSLGSMFVIGLITGERQVFAEPISMKIIGSQFLGLFYFILALVLSLHPFDNSLFILIVFWSFVAESAIRFYKSVVVVYYQGISWYYIILYFCTLEILPLFVAYYLLIRDFTS